MYITNPCQERLPSSKIIIILENKEYMSMVKEKLLDIKRVYKGLKLTPIGTGGC